MESNGIKVEWVEGIPGCEGSLNLVVSSPKGTVDYSPAQVATLLAVILQRPEFAKVVTLRP